MEKKNKKKLNSTSELGETHLTKKGNRVGVPWLAKPKNLALLAKFNCYVQVEKEKAWAKVLTSYY